ncbi:MAG: ornithine cyclodeaminase family protein [Thermoleophilia bacterium]|nr:ornithine cyclodeaminase family protein [Thermoleophilia bacterium]
MPVPFLDATAVERAVPPSRAVRAVRDAFVAYARGEWTMPAKLYVPAYPAGDFRAMPALGAGHALLKWVTSFPGNPARGLPTVTGVVVLSYAATGLTRALLDAGAVTALRTGAAAVLAADVLGRDGWDVAGVVGAGVNGRAVIRTLAALGRDACVFDADAERAQAAVREPGVRGRAATGIDEALACSAVVTVTPGREVIVREGTLRPGQHVSLMGADGPGKAEIAVAELERARVFCDDWEQASHNGDLAHAVTAGAVERGHVTELGAVLTGAAAGRRADDETTVFDSTGLAIQDLAVALAAVERLGELGDVPLLDL